MSFQCPWPDVEISRTNDGPARAYSIRALLAETRDFWIISESGRAITRVHHGHRRFLFHRSRFLFPSILPIFLPLVPTIALCLVHCLFQPMKQKKKQKKITFAATRDTRSKKCNSVSHATTSRKSISDGIMRRARPCKQPMLRDPVNYLVPKRRLRCLHKGASALHRWKLFANTTIERFTAFFELIKRIIKILQTEYCISSKSLSQHIMCIP